MDNRPIGVFDSGLGGLTTVRALANLLPSENIIYFGDTLRVPYGSRSKETINRFAKQDINFLMSHDVKMVITACGTASSVLAEDEDFIPQVLYTGVPLPASKAAYKATKNKRIGVIATPTTIKTNSYKNALCRLDNSIEVFQKACPLFVPLVENGFTDDDNEVTAIVARQYLQELIKQDIDTLILGCTHYPIIKNIIEKVVGKNVTLINSGQEAAIYAYELLKQNDALNLTKKVGEIKLFVSDSVEHFSENAASILKSPMLTNAYQVDIEKY